MSEFTLPARVPDSGRGRYAAAMWLHLRGTLSEDLLETCRSLAMDGRADPAQELRRIGMANAAPPLVP
jgi:hypothetical protein